MPQLNVPSLICDSSTERHLLNAAVQCLYKDHVTSLSGSPWAIWYVCEHVRSIYATNNAGFYGRSLGCGLIQVSLSHGLTPWQMSSVFIHEARHEQQRKQGIDTNSPIEEQMCLREQAYFLERNNQDSSWIWQQIAEVDRWGLAS